MGVGGIRLEYELTGEGPPTLLIGGGVGDRYGLRGQIREMSASLKVISYDRRNCGESEHVEPSAAPDVEVHADDAADLLRRLRVERAHLFGSSYGALIALVTAIRHPRLVRTLTLVEPSAVGLLRGGEMSALYDEFAAAHEHYVRLIEEGRVEEGIRRFMEHNLGDGTWASVPRARRQTLLGLPYVHKAGIEATVRYQIPDDVLRRVEQPTLLIVGDYTAGVFSGVIEHLARLLPRARVKNIPRAEHAVAMKRPGETWNAARKFLLKHSTEDEKRRLALTPKMFVREQFWRLGKFKSL